MAKRVAIVTVFLALLLARSTSAQQVDAQEYTLENGMTLLMVPRSGDPNVAAGWVAKVGSVYERPGITGVAHLFEHMMFKGTHVIGTTDIEADLRIIEQLDDVKAELREEQQTLLDAHGLGQIDDPDDPNLRSPRHTELLKQFDELLARQKELLNQHRDRPHLHESRGVVPERRHFLRLDALPGQRPREQTRVVVLARVGSAR